MEHGYCSLAKISLTHDWETKVKIETHKDQETVRGYNSEKEVSTHFWKMVK